MLRTPTLPVDILSPSSLRQTGQGAVGLAHGPNSENRERFGQILRGLMQHKEVRAAIALASPDLDLRIPAWLDGSLTGKAAQGVERSLVKYLSRMSSRSTPFGLFAGITTGEWGAYSQLNLGPASAGRKAARLDWGVIESIVSQLEQEPAVRSGALYSPNTSLYRRGRGFRYLERRALSGSEATYHLEVVDATPHLDLMLKESRHGARLQPLAEALVTATGVGHQEAREYLDTLIDAQVLHSDLHPPLSCPDPLGHVIDVLLRVPEARLLAKPLEFLAMELNRFEAAPDAGGLGWGEGISAILGSLGVTPASGNLIQVDLFKEAPALALSRAVSAELEKGAETLRRLTPTPQEGPLDRFGTAFTERYGEGWVPLLEALDEESGIGFDAAPPMGSTLMEGIPFRSSSRPRSLSQRDLFLLAQCPRWQGTLIWELTNEDVAGLENPNPEPFAQSFAALTCLSASSLEALDRGEFKFFMDHFSGPTAARWLGRFAWGDRNLEDALRDHLQKEEAAFPEAIFAEVTHSPEGRMGNVLARPALRAYEIPYLANSGVSEDHTLRPDDLVVTVRRGKVFLASKRLGREVIPRLSSAHNFRRGPVVYRFLSHLQDQDGRPGGWSWGALAESPFLPRVVFGRQVLSKARWKIDARELKDALAASQDLPWEAFQLLRERRGLPRLVVLVDADNHLLVDLDQVTQVEALCHLVANRPVFHMTECFPDPSQALVISPEGRFVHELVVPFESTAIPHRQKAPLGQISSTPRIRSFPPGSEWLYLKLYCGTASADRLLQELEPLLLMTGAKHLWDRWHFVRYWDPSHHLRLRFHGEPGRLLSALLPRLTQALESGLSQGLLWKVQIDTFEPEIERYGGSVGFDLATGWFQDDSQRVLEQIASNPETNDRWKSGLVEVDGIWAALGFDLPQRMDLAKSSLEAFRSEFLGKGGAPPQIGQQFRRFRREFETVIPTEPTLPIPNRYGPLFQLRKASEQGRLQEDPCTIACSLAHMHLNRLLQTDQREQEWVLMEFLHRLYDSKLAREATRGGSRSLVPCQ